jgi:hypothetical protein
MLDVAPMRSMPRPTKPPNSVARVAKSPGGGVNRKAHSQRARRAGGIGSSATGSPRTLRPSLCELTLIRHQGDHEDPAEDPLRRASARSSAPSLIVRTASATPPLESPERINAARDGRAELPIGRSRAAQVGAVSPAGASTTVASTFKIGRPSKRARIQASTRTTSERRFPGSGTAVSPAGAVVLVALGIAHARHL